MFALQLINLYICIVWFSVTGCIYNKIFLKTNKAKETLTAVRLTETLVQLT